MSKLFKWPAIIALLILLTFAVLCIGGLIWKLRRRKNEIEKQKNFSRNNYSSLEFTDDSPDELNNQIITEHYHSSVGQYKTISKLQWGAKQPLKTVPRPKTPAKYIIISHTAGSPCNKEIICSRTVNYIQNYHINTLKHSDIKYNFLIGGDEHIYVGLGWDQRYPYMEESVMLSFIGNYVFDELTPGMIAAARKLIEDGVVEEKLEKNYKLVAQNQTENTISPGRNVYKVIKEWPHFTTELLKQ